jgi:hypothetical protein
VEAHEFVAIRKSLKKTQKQMAELLGVSIKAVHSYEQGWRKVPAHVERQTFFLLSRSRGTGKNPEACWTVKKCPLEQRKRCPAWEFRSGTLCWFINGTVCEGEAQVNWREKMKVCRECEILASLLPSRIK